MTEKTIPALQKPPVESKTVTAYSYNHVSRCLFIEFRGTGLYRYHDVPQKLVDQMLKADSIGRFVSKEVIPNHHCEKVNPDELQQTT